MYNLPSFEERMKAAKAKLAPPEPEKGIFRTEFYMSMARIPTCPPPDHRCWQVDCEEDGEVYHDPERNAWDWYNDDERRYWESQGWTEPPFEAGEGAA
ncbi:MAG: hypothetical protein M1832_001648 [Thelocarpon impressellum]|nr:MAG: hypothetical protein M1832_001648 [Thelocarpon impressellum]